jgi:hypothetical protein
MKPQEDPNSFGATFGGAMETVRQQERKKTKRKEYSQKELAWGAPNGSLQRFEQTKEISLRSPTLGLF